MYVSSILYYINKYIMLNDDSVLFAKNNNMFEGKYYS